LHVPGNFALVAENCALDANKVRVPGTVPVSQKLCASLEIVRAFLEIVRASVLILLSTQKIMRAFLESVRGLHKTVRVSGNCARIPENGVRVADNFARVSENGRPFLEILREGPKIVRTFLEFWKCSKNFY
jgi:hypothetical protein